MNTYYLLLNLSHTWVAALLMISRVDQKSSCDRYQYDFGKKIN